MAAGAMRLGSERFPLLTWDVGFSAGISRLSAAKPHSPEAFLLK
jgi:hypothetical protein